jgi:hypothetical protein
MYYSPVQVVNKMTCYQQKIKSHLYSQNNPLLIHKLLRLFLQFYSQLKRVKTTQTKLYLKKANSFIDLKKLFH